MILLAFIELLIELQSTKSSSLRRLYSKTEWLTLKVQATRFWVTNQLIIILISLKSLILLSFKLNLNPLYLALTFGNYYKIINI